MAHPLTTMFAQTYKATSTYAATVTDSGTGSPRAATFFTGAATSTPKYGRIFLATAAGAGASASDAHETLAHVEAALNSGSGGTLWRVELTTTGYVKVTYLGTGNGTVAWDSSGSNAVRMLLGFTTDVGPLAANASQTAARQPTHVAYAFATRGDRGWVHDPHNFVGAELPDGQVYGWTDNYVRLHRTLDLRFLPKDAAARASLGEDATACYPPASAWRSPSGALGYDGAWSWAQLLRTAYSDGTSQGRLGVAIGDLQTLIASGGTAYEACLTPKTLAALGTNATPDEAPDWDEPRDWTGLELAGASVITVAAAV